jgi:hypothetical protein
MTCRDGRRNTQRWLIMLEGTLRHTAGRVPCLQHKEESCTLQLDTYYAHTQRRYTLKRPCSMYTAIWATSEGTALHGMASSISVSCDQCWRSGCSCCVSSSSSSAAVSRGTQHGAVVNSEPCELELRLMGTHNSSTTRPKQPRLSSGSRHLAVSR